MTWSTNFRTKTSKSFVDPYVYTSLLIGESKPQELPCTLAHRVENARTVH